MVPRLFSLTILALMLFILAACGGDKEEPAAAVEEAAAPVEEVAVSVGDAANGETLYSQTCIACHGPGGIGVVNLGKDMTQSEFIADLNDAELLAFIKRGRDVSDPANTTGVAMPPKGGNPAISDEQIMDIVAYIRTIHQ